MSRFDQGLKKEFGGNLANLKEAAGNPVPPKPDPEAAPADPSQEQSMAPSRRGKVAISAYFDPAVRKQLAILAVRQDCSQAAMMAEALNLLFERYNEPPIAKA